MSQEFATFKLFEALSLAQNTSANAVRIIESGPDIKLDYCIPKKFTKRRTDISGAEAVEDVGPDTGPAGAFVEIRITLNRRISDQQELLDTIIRWYAKINTAEPFRRGFLGLENDDNPKLSLNPTNTLGYKLSDAGLINPVDNKGRQQYIILLQLLGDANELPNLT